MPTDQTAPNTTPARLRRFTHGQRVLVHAAGLYEDMPLDPPAAGKVVRQRRADDGAWIQLDQRFADSSVHPFPTDDDAGRGTHVCAFPENCEALP